MTFYRTRSRTSSANPRRSGRAKRSGANTTPVNFDPATHPILAAHWFGVEPLHDIGPIAAEAASNRRRQRQIHHVYGLGPRAVHELLYDVAGGEDLDHALAAYACLTPGLLRAVGGDRFPPFPLKRRGWSPRPRLS